jgi:threonine/homoserine/homoserine lactone efflux protein
MIEPTTYGLFLLAVLTLFLSPGPNMAFVLSHGVAHGVRGGFAAALGIGLADVIFTVLTATGITALVAAWPPSFDILRYAGAIYLVWLAINAIRHPGGIGTLERQNESFTNIVRRATINNLLNPKALLFYMVYMVYMVFLPQFVKIQNGNVPSQILILGFILTIAGVLFNILLGAFSGQVGVFLKRNPNAAKYQGWFLGVVLLALAVRLLLLERPAIR